MPPAAVGGMRKPSREIPVSSSQVESAIVYAVVIFIAAHSLAHSLSFSLCITRPTLHSSSPITTPLFPVFTICPDFSAKVVAAALPPSLEYSEMASKLRTGALLSASMRVNCQPEDKRVGSESIKRNESIASHHTPLRD